jgi:hypothetical protein
MVLSSALPPLSAKVVGKIKSGQYVPMKDLLADNMSLCTQLEALTGPHSFYAGFAKPRLREIQSPLTWVSCFLAYTAVLTPDAKTRNLLTYGWLVIREAQCHGGLGWQEYDKIFRQHAALAPSVQWNELNPSLHASTIMTIAPGPVSAVGCVMSQTMAPITVLWWDCRRPHPLSQPLVPHQGVSPNRAGQSAGHHAQRQQRGSASPGIVAAALSPPAPSAPRSSQSPYCSRDRGWAANGTRPRAPHPTVPLQSDWANS